MNIHQPSALRVQPIFFLFLLSITLCWTACGPDEDPPVDTVLYPILFKYQKLDFQPSKSYVLTANAYQELPAGVYSLEPYVEEELAIDDWGFEIEKVELLDNTHLRLYFFPALSITPADTIVSYETIGDNEIKPQMGVGSTLQFRWDKENKRLHLDLLAVQYAYFDAAGDLDYSPLDIDQDFHIETTAAALIEQQRLKWNLQPGDTLLLNRSGWLYPEQ